MTGLRVAYVLGTTAGGTGRHVAMLAEAGLRAGHTVSVFGPASTGSLFAGAGGAAFAAVQIAAQPRPAGDVAAVRRLRRLLRQTGPDVVHAHGLRAGALTAIALAGAGRRRPALVVTVHNAPPGAAVPRAVYVGLEQVIARRSEVVSCVSADLAERMRRRGARHTALAVVPAPWYARPGQAAVSRAAADVGAAGGPVVLAAGPLTGQKGFDVLLDAARQWQHRQPRPLLTIAGDGPLAASLAGQAGRYGVAVRFLGQRSDIAALLDVATVLAAPSRWEGQPLLLQEALQAGTPIVASLVGGVPELTGADAALLVPPDDPAALAAAVLRVLDDTELAGRLAAAGLARAASLPTPADAAAAAWVLYQTALAARQGGIEQRA